MSGLATSAFVLDEHLVRDAERARTELDTLAQVISATVSFADDFAGARAYARGERDRRRRARRPQEWLPHRHDHLRTRRIHGHLRHRGRRCRDLRGGDRLSIINANPADATLADRLLYAGKVRSGFTEGEARDLRERLDPFIRKDSPLSEPVKKPKATWVEPASEACRL